MATQTRTLKQLAQDVTITATRREPTAQEQREHDEEEKRIAAERGGSINYADDARYFTVTLVYRGRRMTVPFRQGSAWTTNPTAADVLECVISDSDGYDNARDFEEWASEYGYDADSRRAERIYKQVAKQRDQVRYLLGTEYRAFVEAERD